MSKTLTLRLDDKISSALTNIKERYSIKTYSKAIEFMILRWEKHEDDTTRYKHETEHYNDEYDSLRENHESLKSELKRLLEKLSQEKLKF